MEITDKKLREILHNAQGEQTREQVLYSWIMDNVMPPSDSLQQTDSVEMARKKNMKTSVEYLAAHIRGLTVKGACEVVAMIIAEQWKYYEEHPDTEPNITRR